MKFPLTKEQRDLQERVQTLADGEFRERAAGWDEREEYPWENVKTLVKEGLMGMAIPREYGGQGRALLDVILAIETVARTCGITGRLLVDSNLGPVGGDRPLRERGTKDDVPPPRGAGRQAGHRHHRASGGLRRLRHGDDHHARW